MLAPNVMRGQAAYSRPVNFVRRLRDRWHALIRELTKFGIIGVLNTALDFAVWNAVLFIGPIKAQVVSTLISATSSYFMNRHWTFRHRARSGLRREYLLFFGFNAVGLVITAGILGVATYAFGVENVAALNVVKLCAIAVATAFRFWAYRRWVFLHPDDQLYEPAEEPAGQR